MGCCVVGISTPVGIDIKKLATQTKALFANSEYTVDLVYEIEMEDILPTISIRRKDFLLFFKDMDIENIRRILEQSGLKPIGD